MTPEMVAQWALEVGIRIDPRFGEIYTGNVQLAAFAAKVAAHEREMCAKVCDAEALQEEHIDDRTDYVATYCAAAIRARK